MALTRGGRGKLLVDNAAGVPTDLTPWMEKVEWGDFETETMDSTVWGQDSKSYLPGLGDGKLSAEGKFDSVAGGPDVILRAIRGLGPLTVEWQPEGAGTGKPFRRVEAILSSYVTSAEIGEIITWSAEWQASGVETTGTLV